MLWSCINPVQSWGWWCTAQETHQPEAFFFGHGSSLNFSSDSQHLDVVVGVLPGSKVRRNVSIAKVFSFRHTVNPHYARAGLESIEKNLTRGARSDVMN